MSKVKLDLLTDIDILLMVEKGIRSRMCHVIHQCTKVSNKCMKDYEKKKKIENLNILTIGT